MTYIINYFKRFLMSNFFRFLFSETFYFVLFIILFVFVFIDFGGTLYSVYIAKYAIETNGIILKITPFGALFLNIFNVLLFKDYKKRKFIPLIGNLYIYGLANRMHILNFLELFVDGASSVSFPF